MSQIRERVDQTKKDKLKTKSVKDKDGAKYIETKPTLDEAVKKQTAVISFGRMNPITVGHEKLVNAVISTAVKQSGDPLIYLSHTQDKKKNPLSYDEKISFAQKAFGKVITKSSSRSIMAVAEELQNKYSNLVVVVGSDRVKEFDTLLNKYNGKNYNYDSIKVVSAGDRDPDADDVTGMSASKMRTLAKDGDMESFIKGLPRKLQSQGKRVYDAVRSGMAISESLEEMELDEALNRQQRLKRSMIMRRLKSKIAMGRRKAMRRKATSDVLKKRARKKVLDALKQKFAKGEDYKTLEYSARQRIDDKVAKIPANRIDVLVKRVLPKVKAAEKKRIAGSISKENPTNILKQSNDYSHFREDVNSSFEQLLESRKTHLEKAIELAESLGGNTNYAIKEIEKIKKGISKHHLVKEALSNAKVNFSQESYQEYTIEKRVEENNSYHSGLSKSTKDKRKAHFNKGAKMDDDNPAAYEPAPGDATAETKPSKHTAKFKKMFGEVRVNHEKAHLKKPHMLLAKNGSVKIDKRFKMFKKAKEVDALLAAEIKNESLVDDINQIAESVEFIFESNPKAALKKKAEKSGMPYGILKKVFDRGVAAWRTGHRPGTTATQWGLARVNSFATKSKGTWGKADKDLADKVRSEEVNLDEKLSTGNVFKKAIAQTLKKKTVDKAIELVKKAIASDKKHGPEYHVADVIRKNNFDINPKVLYNIMFEEGGAGEWGTDELTAKLKKDTPNE